MEVEVAKKSGFCFGVKRAIDWALKVGERCNTIGPLIHNPHVVEDLKKKGIIPVEEIDDIDSSTVILRTHGVSKKVIDELNKKGLHVVDLTCPFVKKVKDYAIELEKQGYFIVVIGEKNHPEVEAIVSHLKNVVVVNSVSDVGKVGERDKVGVVVQTTQTLKLFQDIVAELRKRYNELKVCNTICNATAERQEEAIELAKGSDIMIVVGGKNSANTNHLAELCDAIVETHHVQGADDLKNEWFKGKKKAGVTAGASTSTEIIKKVKKMIEAYET